MPSALLVSRRITGTRRSCAAAIAVAVLLSHTVPMWAQYPPGPPPSPYSQSPSDLPPPPGYAGPTGTTQADLFAPPPPTAEYPWAIPAAYSPWNASEPSLIDQGSGWQDPALSESGEPVLRPHKDGFFQKLSFTSTWIDRGALDSVGVTELEIYLTTAIPIPSREQPLIITPGFDTRFFDGPNSPDLPAAVYDAYLQTMWFPRWNENWSAILSVAPGVYSDFQSADDASLRIVGKGLVRWEIRPGQLELLLGVLYLDRTDFNLVPAGGLIMMPRDSVRYELVFPRPKIAWRLRHEPGLFEDWLYIAGEFGGDQWSVQRAGGRETLTMRDLRATLGLERKRDGGAGQRLEVAYVFARNFEFSGGDPDYEPDDSVMIRFGAAF